MILNTLGTQKGSNRRKNQGKSENFVFDQGINIMREKRLFGNTKKIRSCSHFLEKDVFHMLLSLWAYSTTPTSTGHHFT